MPAYFTRHAAVWCSDFPPASRKGLTSDHLPSARSLPHPAKKKRRPPITQSGSAATEDLTTDYANNTDGSERMPPTKHSKKARNNEADFRVVSFVWWAGKMLFAVLVVFCSRFMADEKSLQVAMNFAYKQCRYIGWHSFCASLVFSSHFPFGSSRSVSAQWVRKNFFSLGRKRSDAPTIGRSVVIICKQTTMKIALQNFR